MSLPQLGDLGQFFDASLHARPLWPFREQQIAISSPSDNCAGGKRALVGPQMFVHRHKLETKLGSCGAYTEQSQSEMEHIQISAFVFRNAKEVEMKKAAVND
jgi:hypothetical protein